MATSDHPQTTMPPRLFVRAAWALHRTMVRLSGGRLGLPRPKIGKRFGMMQLETIGRRSGSKRSVIVGYFEDGSNLVTLAMNGWAEDDPAWWLNLQAHPDATVAMKDGTRHVRARSAMGPERDRLWDLFDQYPGWGDNLDALSAMRSRETTIVVLEPVSAEDRGKNTHSGSTIER